MAYDHLPSDDLIEINDPDIDPAAIMADIRARMRQRREELGYDRRNFPTFATAYPEEPADLEYDPNLYHHLRLANETYTQAETEPFLAPSPATSLPIIGALWRRIRGGAHNLVIYYVNRAIAHHVNVHRHMVSVLNRLTAQAEEQQRTIATLQEEVAALRAQLGEDE